LAFYNKLDILILNEIYNGGTDGLLDPQFNYTILFLCNPSDNPNTCGVALLFNNKIFNPTTSSRIYRELNNDRMIYTKLQFLASNTDPIEIFGIYVTAQIKERSEFFSNLTQLSHLISAKPLILAGNFNTIMSITDHQSTSKASKLDKSYYTPMELILILNVQDSHKV
jgi:exonuclease III